MEKEKKERLNSRKTYRKGEIRYQYGSKEYAKCIEYINSREIIIKFLTTNKVIKTRWDHFDKGKVSNGFKRSEISFNEFALQQIFKSFGFKKANKGELKDLGLQNLELDLYNPDFNGYKIAIEYDGFFDKKRGWGHIIEKDLIKDKLCEQSNIILIRIREPKLPNLDSSSKIFKLKSSEVMSNDLKDVINDIVSFLNKNYNGSLLSIDKFNEKEIITAFHSTYGINSRVGKVNTMNCGMKAKIIEYFNSKHIIIEFEDKYTTKTTYSDFIRGNVSNINVGKNYKWIKSVLHKTYDMSDGSKATVIAARNREDVDALFDTGELRENVNIRFLRNGTLSKDPTKKRKRTV